MMWGIFSWQKLCSLIPIEHDSLNVTVYLNIVADSVPFTIHLLKAILLSLN